MIKQFNSVGSKLFRCERLDEEVFLGDAKLKVSPKPASKDLKLKTGDLMLLNNNITASTEIVIMYYDPLEIVL